MQDIYKRHGGQPDEPHRHDFYTVLLIEKATGKHVVDFKEFDLGAHQVFFLSPGQVHQMLEQEASIGYSMVFSEEFLIENDIPCDFINDINLFQDYGHFPPLEVDAEKFQRLEQYCKDIQHYYHSNDKFKEQAIGSLIKLFLIQCNNLCSLPAVDLHLLDAANNILRNFKKLVEENYKQWHGTSEYANELFISPDHLNRSVKTLIGKTAKEYIQSRIVIAAKRLLYFSELSSKEIGYELGFNEPAHFSSFFKKATGISTTEFRNNR